MFFFFDILEIGSQIGEIGDYLQRGVQNKRSNMFFDHQNAYILWIFSLKRLLEK